VATKKQRANKARRRHQHQRATGSPERDTITDAIVELKTLRQGGRVVEAGRATVPLTTLPGIRVVLDTGDIVGVSRGLPVEATTEIFLNLHHSYPDSPPTVCVDINEKYVGYPHVIRGHILCVYLDPKREWHPTFGMAQVIDRIWEWLDNAANDRFDPRASLFHAVGGDNPVTDASTTVVVRSGPPLGLDLTSQSAMLVRTSNRIDIVGWRRARRRDFEIPLPTFVVPAPLPFGVCGNVAAVAAQVEQAGGCKINDFCNKIVRIAAATRISTPVHLCLIVTHPTEADLPSVVVGRINAQLADRLRAAQTEVLPAETTIDWLHMSDERPETTTRRDVSRPAANFLDSSVEIWGCGGLGSWIAELVVRASPQKVVLREPGLVHRGLLVRQNYTELDVGHPKAAQLAKRLQAISDDTEVIVGSSSAIDAIKDGEIPPCDLVIDATISEAVAFHLDKIAARDSQGPLIIQVATDISSASLGLLVVAPASCSGGPATVEDRVADAVLDRADLEPYHTFWNPASPTAELTPAPGCSVPTYHGAAADLASIAGSMVSLAGAQLNSPVAGIHLFAAPHSGILPSLVFQPLDMDGDL